MMFNKKGFTLIELVVVIIIIGILAAIAFPMMRGNIEKAKKSEAVAALGTIRTAERLYFVEHDQYTDVGNFNDAANPLSTYIQPADLAGQYYSAICFNVTGATNTAFLAWGVGNTDGSTAPKSSEVTGAAYDVNIDQDGTIGGF